MPMDVSQTVSRFLDAAAGGDREAASRLLPLVYTELRKLARARMGHLQPGQTLQPTALVHEAFMRLVRNTDPGWDGRGHFFAAAAQAMRDILVDQARRKASLKRGGDRGRYDLADVEIAAPEPTADVLALNEAIELLEAEDPRKGQIVNMRYFAGLTATETAAAMDLSVTTIEREWRYIRSWLFKQLDEGRPDEEVTHDG